MIKIFEEPDMVTSSGYNDISSNIINSAINKLMTNGVIGYEDWDVKGNKFTVRLKDKVVVIKTATINAEIKVINTQSRNEQIIKVTNNVSNDVNDVENAILTV